MTETKYKNIFVDGRDVYKGNHKLCQWIDNVGYYQVSFRDENKKRHYVRVHRLIAETLLPNPDNLSQVNHIDGNKLNNDLSNLEWVSNSKNTQHGYDNNLYHSKKRSHAVIATNKKTGEKIIFKSIRNCSEKLGLNRKTITSILKNNKTNNYDWLFEYKEE